MVSGTPRALGDLLTTALPQLGDRLTEFQLRRSWAALVGPDAARRTHPQSIVNGCLHVVVDNSPWLQELTLRSADLVARLGEKFPTIQSVRFVLGTIPSIAPSSVAPPARSEVPLSAADLREIDEAMAPIHDPALAASARRLLARARRFPRARGAAS